MLLVYLIETDSKFLTDEQLSKIIGESKNKISYTLEEHNLSDILEEAAYISMFQEMKYIIVRNATFFGKGKIDEKESIFLERYLENPNPYTTLIFTVYDEVDKRKSFYKKIADKDGYMACKSPKGYELQEKTRNLLKKKGYIADDKIVYFIIQACLSNWDLINQEVSKLTLVFPPKTTLKLEELKKIICNNAQDNQFKFVGAVIDKKGEETFKLLNDLLLLKEEPISLFNLLAREYRNMLTLKLMINKNFSRFDIMKELKLQDWQYQKLAQNASKYHEDDIKEAIVKIGHYDVQIKSGKIDRFIALQMFLIEMLEY